MLLLFSLFIIFILVVIIQYKNKSPQTTTNAQALVQVEARANLCSTHQLSCTRYGVPCFYRMYPQPTAAVPYSLLLSHCSAALQYLCESNSWLTRGRPRCRVMIGSISLSSSICRAARARVQRTGRAQHWGTVLQRAARFTRSSALCSSHPRPPAGLGLRLG